MAYELTFSLSLGISNAGLTDLRAQLFDDAGTDVGSAVSSGFVDHGQGFYTWNYTSVPDDHRGGVRFYSNAASSTMLSVGAINPEEAEYTDTKVSGLATTLSSISSSIAAIPAAVWAVTTSGLTTAGTIGKLLVDNIDAAISSISVATIWNTLTSTFTVDGSAGKLLVNKLSLLTGPINTATNSTAALTITRAATLNGETITDVTVPANWSKCYFTAKDDIRDDTDAQSLIQIVVTDGGDAGDGLLYLNAAAATAGHGALTVGVDDVIVTLADDASALLADCRGIDFDVKFLNDDGTSFVGRRGTLDVDLTATRTV